MNILMNGLLNSLLSIISSLSIILHMFLVTLNYPVEMINFFSLLFPLITFDVFPVSNVYEKWFHFSEITTNHPLTSQYNTVGYSSIFLISNIGSLYLFVNIQLAVTIILLLLRRYKPFRRIKIVQRRVDKFVDNWLWSSTIGFFASNYLVLSVVSYIESNDLRFGRSYTATENFCSFLACIGMTFSLVFPVLIFSLYMYYLRYINPNLRTDEMLKAYKGKRPALFALSICEGNTLQAVLLETKQHKYFMNTFGLLIKGLKIKQKHSFIVVMTPVFDLLFKLLIAVTVTRLVDYPVF